MTTDNGAAIGSPATQRGRASAPPSFTRILLGVVFGFFACAATMSLGFAIGFAVLGKDQLLEAGTWDTAWGAQVAAVGLAAVGAFFGGSLCRLIVGSARVSIAFSVLLLALLGGQWVLRWNATTPGAPRDPATTEIGTIAQHTHPGLIAVIGVPIAAGVMSAVGGAAAGGVQRTFFGR